MADKSIDKVAVVIPNLNGENYIGDAIDSLLKQTLLATIIVVENASTDGSLAILESYGDKIVVLKNEKNLGFAGGVNVGITYALDQDFDAVALLNNDAVATPEWLQELVKAMNQNDSAGIITGQIQLSSGSLLDSTGEFYTTWGMPYPRGREEPVGSYSKAGEVFGASGGASLYRSTTLNEIGLFDDKFFAYYEDTDISFRAQLAGWKVLYEPSAVVSHRQGETSKRMVKGFTVYQTFKNLPMLFWKNVPLGMLPLIGIRFLLAYILIFAKAVVNGKAWPALKGLGASIALALHTLAERRRIQKAKAVTNDYINSIIVHDLPPNQTGIRKLRKLFTRH